MADRTTRVTLVANVSGYLNGMDQAARKTRDMGDAAAKLGAQREAFTTLGRGMLALGAVAAAGVGLAIKRFSDFDAAMSSVQAATHETAGNMSELRDAALEAGESTVYTATEAASAIENLAKAGISTKDILGGGLAGALNLAAAGELAVGDAAEIAATAMTQFNLKGTEVPHIADLLAAGAGKAQGSVQDMSAALNQSGLVASQMGLSIEETAGTLALFAKNGLIGSDAGTSFRTMLLRLANPTEESKDLMQELGIAAYDAQGNFVGMASVADQLKTSLEGKTQADKDSALATLFGSDAIRAASVLYDEGAAGVEEWTAKVDDSGYAAETAALRLDNLQGDVEKLGGAFDTALIKSGSAANDALRILTQTATDAVDGFNDMDPAVQGVALGVGGLVSAASLAAGAFFVAVPKIAEFNSALETMGPGAQRAGRAVVGLGKGLAVVAGATAAIAILDQIANSGREAAEGVEEVTNALLHDDLSSIFEGIGGDVNNFTEGLRLLTASDVNSFMERFGDTATNLIPGLQGVYSQVEETRGAFETTGQALADLVNSGEGERAAAMFQEMAAGADLQGVSTQQLLDLMPAYQEALSGVSNEQELAAGTGDEASAAVEALGGAAAETSDEVAALSDALRNFGSVTLDARAANRDLEQAVDDAKQAFKENGETLNITTQKGRDNQAALDDIAKSANNAAAATWDNTKSEKALQGSLSESRSRLIAAATQFGMSQTAAERYAAKVLATPKAVKTAVSLTGVGAAENALAYLARGRTAHINVVTTGSAGVGGGGAMRVSADGNLFENQRAVAFASGGFGPGIYNGSAGPLYKFAEPETRWEAFISGKPGQERRNLEIWAEAGRRLGAGVGGGASSGATQNVNINVQQHYPINEPGSEGVRRAGQLAAATLGGL